MKIYDCMNILLTRAQQVVSQKYKEALADYELNPMHYATLKCLWEFGNLTPGQLSEAAFIDRPSMTSVLDKLERSGYIERVPDHYDRRSIRIYLTPNGEGIKEQVLAATAEIQSDIIADIREMNPDITDVEIKEFYRLLRLIANIPDA